jgi:hypothetical protein
MKPACTGSSTAMTDIPYIIRGGLAGRERLRLLSGVLRSMTRALLDRVGVADGARCLDVGCGGGDVSLELAARGGRVLGVDVDEEKLGIARGGRGGGTRSDLPPGRRHERGRRQRLGPLLLALPADAPHRPGRRRPAPARRAGFHGIASSAVQPMAIEGDVKLACALTLDSIADAAVAEGVAERGEIEQVAADLHREAADRVTLFSFPRIVQVWGYTGTR